MAALGIVHPRVRQGILDSPQDSDVPGSGSVVIAHQRPAAVRVGPDDAHGLQALFLQGQDAIVLQQHHALRRCPLRQLQMLPALDPVIGGVVIGRLVK